MMSQSNIVWHPTHIKREDREELLRQRGIVMWFTGLSGSGKSTVANAVEKKLFKKGRATYLLDGDNVRHGLNKDLGFSAQDRVENIRRIAEVSKLFMDAGIITLTAFISPFREDRSQVRELLKDRFVEIFVECSLDVCMERDPKGLYAKARRGEIKDFTGIDSPYEKPLSPDIVVHSDKMNPEECAEHIIKELGAKGLLK